MNSVSQFGCTALHFAATLKDRAACQVPCLQGYLAHKKQPPSKTLQLDHA